MLCTRTPSDGYKKFLCMSIWLVAFKHDFQFHIKHVIISCEFLQYFNYSKVLLCSWMSQWCLYILGTWIQVVNYLEKIIVLEKVDLTILWTDSNTVLLEKYM